MSTYDTPALQVLILSNETWQAYAKKKKQNHSCRNEIFEANCRVQGTRMYNTL